jgi:flavin-dependent dehydrogenase
MKSMSSSVHPYDAIVVGGGPAGSAIARLLTTWGHRVVLLDRSRAVERGLAESIPPSTRKLLQTIGFLDAVTQADFVPNRGNVVWWGSDRARTEDFGDAADLGFQVYRPRFDAVLLDDAERAGAEIQRGVLARSIDLDDAGGVRVLAERGADRLEFCGRFVVDASGRAGILARQGYRQYQDRHRMQAFVGMWRRDDGFTADVSDRTIIETYDDGWAWSLPVTATVRQVAMMVDGTTTQTSRGPTIADTYRAELAKTHQLQALVGDAILDRAWACDASMYSSRRFAGPRFLLVGDAATCIDPLSSFGVKKALASAWLGAIALHTALVDDARRTLAFDFFSARESEVYAAELARTEAFAQRALTHHDHPFWGVRGAEPQATPAEADVDRLLRGPRVRDAYARLRAMDSLSLQWRAGLAFTTAPRVHGHEIVLDDAVPIGASAARFAAGIDLVALGHLAVAHDSVPSTFAAYARTHGEPDLPQFLAALSLLLAEGLLL